MPKVLYVATVVKTHIMEFHIPYLKMFKDLGWETAVAARNDYENPSNCMIPYCDTYYNVPFERNPFKLSNIKAYLELKRIINNEKYDVIHCHTPVGALLTRLAAIEARNNGSRVFYTAHGFHFYKGASIINWLLYYPVEKILSRFTDVIITINQEDYIHAQSFYANKVFFVPGVGIDIKRFCVSEKAHDCFRAEIRQEFRIPKDAVVVLSVGELNKNKNHISVIKALKQIKKLNLYYIICGSGPLREKYFEMGKQMEGKLILAGYRKDVNKFYQAADLFVLPSKREGLPVAVMEAMASGLPIVCSKIRGCQDLIKEGENGCFANCLDPESIRNAVEWVTAKPQYDLICARNKKDANLYSIDSIKEQYKKIFFA